MKEGASPDSLATSRGGLGATSPLTLFAPEPPVLPPALLKFLRSPEPRTLLITGPPGAGKTTLALSLMSSLDASAFYISTRVGRGNLLHHFPWLVGVLPPERLIDLEDVRPKSDRQEELIHAMDRLTDSIDPLSAGRRLREFLNLSDTLGRTLSATPASVGRRYLFIDSWDGLVEPYVHLLGLDELGRNSLEHGLLALFQAAGFTLVLSTEQEESSALAYLADGVVAVGSTEVGGTIARFFQVRKLRGVPVDFAGHPFTLHGARFTYLPPLLPIPPNASSIMSPPPPEVPPPSGHLPLGIPILDPVSGSLAPGETLLAELDGRGPSTPLAYLLGPLWAEALRTGWSLVLLSDLAHPPSLIEEGLTASFPKMSLKGRVTLLPHGTHRSGEELWNELVGSIRPKTALDVSIRTLGVLLRERGEPLVSRLAELELEAREKGAILVLVAGSNDPEVPTLSAMVGKHLVVREHFGGYLTYGISPRFPTLAMVAIEPREAGLRVRFLPAV